MWAQGWLDGGTPGAGMECGVMPPSALLRFDRLPLMLLLSGLCHTGFSLVLVSIWDEASPTILDHMLDSSKQSISRYAETVLCVTYI